MSGDVDITKANLIPLRCGVALVLAILVAYIYWPVRDYDFVDFDDNVYLVENERLQDGLTTSNVLWAFSTRHHANWHPLTWLTYLTEIEVFGLRPGPMHVTNAMLHYLSGLLLFGFLGSFTRAWWRSALVALLFTVHPLHVESVAWISERKDVLCAAFSFGTLWAYSRWTVNRSNALYGLTLALYACALMAKPMAVTVPLLLLLMDYWPRMRSVPMRKRVASISPFFLLAIACGLATLWAQQGGSSIQDTAAIPLDQRLMNAAISTVTYLKLTVWPTGLAVFYPHPRDTVSMVGALFALGSLIGISVVAFRYRRAYPALAFGWLWFLVTLAPVIGILQVGAQAMADRYTYVPLIGIFIAFAWLPLSGVLPSERLRVLSVGFVVVLYIGTLSFGARAQVNHWANTETLFTRAIAVTQNNVLAHDILGRYFLRDGRYEEASQHFQAGVEINPDYPEGRLHLGLAFVQLDRYIDALKPLQNWVIENPESVDGHIALAKSYGGLNDVEGCREHFGIALRLREDNPIILTAYGAALAQIERPTGHKERLLDAVKLFETALEHDPQYEPAIRNLATARALLADEENEP